MNCISKEIANKFINYEHSKLWVSIFKVLKIQLIYYTNLKLKETMNNIIGRDRTFIKNVNINLNDII
jgi:hypothetical protein